MSQHPEYQYLNLLTRIKDEGVRKENRTGVDTLSVFDARMSFDLSIGDFPLYTSKLVDLPTVVAEHDWFMSGSTSVNDLVKKGCNIWNLWNDARKEIGLNLEDRAIVRVDRQTTNQDITDQYADHIEDLLKFHAKMINKFELLRDNTEDKANRLLIAGVGKIWREYFEHSLINYCEATFEDVAFAKSMKKYFKPSILAKKASVDYLCVEYLDPLTFIKDVQTFINYNHYIDAGFKQGMSIFSIPWMLTGFYSGSRVLDRDNAKFIHRDELSTYVLAEANGVTKVWFNPSNVGERRPMYLFSKDQVESRIDKPDQVRLLRKTRSISKSNKNTLLRYSLGDGKLGPVYGKQFRRATAVQELPDNKGKKIVEVDQVQRVIDLLKNDPDSRRNIIDLWNLSDLDRMRLMPCHYTVAFYTVPISKVEARRFIKSNVDKSVTIDELPTRKVCMKFKMRSNDVPIGNPYNVASYATMLLRIASAVNMVPGDLIFDGDDCHIYVDQLDDVKVQLKRKPRPFPTYKMMSWGDQDLTSDSFKIEGYKPHPAIKMKVAK